MLTSAVSEHAIDPATTVFVDLSRGLTMNDGQLIRKSRDRTYRHAMRYQDDWYIAPSCSEIERETVGVAMVGRNSEVEPALLKNFEIPRVKTDQLNHSQNPEELITMLQSSHELEDSSWLKVAD
jgi:hypothetical protein